MQANGMIFWDWNGTLMDDLDFTHSCLNWMLETHGYPQRYDLAAYREIFGFPIEEYYIRAGFDFARHPYPELAECFMAHYNVGGLPDTVDFKELVEPLRNLFKDEVRQAGRELGLPEYLVSRQPFPGPGLGIRIIGEVTPEKVAIVQDADAIWREEIAKAGLDKEISQYYAALTNMHSVGVMGDERTYDYAVALRAVTTTDFMTAESYNMPWDVLGTVTSRIVNEVKHVNRVFYDCTGKPPATIELE